MSVPTRIRLAAVALALPALALPAAALAGVLPEPDPEKAELSTTGNDSELVRALPISKAPGTKERVVMSLGPERLKRIRSGERLRVSGEMQVSTTCVAKGPRCIGRRYDFNPRVGARIVLSASPNDPTAASIPLSESRAVLCKQRRPNRNHHCTLAFPNLETPPLDPAALPCPSNGCYVNMIAQAWRKKAKRGNRVVLGADRPDGSVSQDKGRLNVVQLRPEVAAPSVQSTGELVNTWLPLNEGKRLKRRVIHSLPITAPRKNDVLTFDGGYQATIDQLPFNVFLSTRVIVAETPTATAPGSLAKSTVQRRAEATEANGFNCTQGRSGYQTPCTPVKAGAIRITQDAIDPNTGSPATLYVNLVGSAKPLLADRKLKDTHQVLVGPSAGFTVARYSAPAG